MKRQAGFTLIELVMVIVILGILAAFALPRFADLGGEARAAALQGAYGAMKSASSIAHADYLVQGDNTLTEIRMEGDTIDIVNGYPQAIDYTAVNTSGGILDAAQVTTGATGDFDSDDTNAGPAAGDVIVVSPKGVTDAADCNVTYTAASAGNSPLIVLTIDTSGTNTGCD